MKTRDVNAVDNNRRRLIGSTISCEVTINVNDVIRFVCSQRGEKTHRRVDRKTL